MSLIWYIISQEQATKPNKINKLHALTEIFLLLHIIFDFLQV